MDGDHRHRAAGHGAVRHHRGRRAVGLQHPEVPRHRHLRRRLLAHRPVAARGRRLHRPAGRRHRHRRERRAGVPADRPAGGRADGLPAHRELHRPGPQRPGGPGAEARPQGRLRRHLGAGPVLRFRLRAVFPGKGRAGVFRGGDRARTHGPLEPGRVRDLAGQLRRHLRLRRGQRQGPEVSGRPDPGEGARPEDCRTADPEGLSVRLQARPAGLRLLRDVQPAARAPGRREIQPCRRDHPRRAAADGRHGVRVRCHRLCDRLRRDDRGAEQDRHPGPGRAAAAGEVGRRATHLPGADERRIPEPVHDHRPAEPVGAVEHAGVDRAARRVHLAGSSARCATAARGPSSGACAEDAWVAHNHELAQATLFPTADTWFIGANIPGKPRVFLPYLGLVGPYRQRCDEIAAAGFDGFEFTGSTDREGAPA